jgi:hypothetical protein
MLLSEYSVSLISKDAGFDSNYLFEPLILIYLTSEALIFKNFNLICIPRCHNVFQKVSTSK